ncbi:MULTISPECIES: hypothetical protein [Yersinia]|nr:MULTISPECIES: hypothetical protein [Yersinia]MDA5497984.1 hypothetical protein [Yersinia aleksiciae]CNE77426.1 Uncharacterised protein [Yersinia mollaretii]
MLKFDDVLKNGVSLLTILTVFTYAVSYLFQWGYSSHFGYPVDLIQIDFNIILKTLVWLFFILSPFIFLLWWCFSKFDFDNDQRIWMPFLRFTLVLILTNVVFYLCVFGAVSPSVYFNKHGSVTVTNLIIMILFPMAILLKIFTDKYLGEKHSYAPYFFLALTFIASVFNLGKIVAFSSSPFYQMEDDKQYVLLNSFSGSNILGSCTADGVKIIKIDASESLKLVRVTSKIKNNEIKMCFQQQRYINSIKADPDS